MADFKIFFCCLCVTLFSCILVLGSNDILCEQGFCRSFRFDVGCAEPPIHCSVMNATHRGIRLPSPTLCNCCDFCMPFIEEGGHCVSRAPGAGNTVGRCGDGLNCTASEEYPSGWGSCARMKSKCHDAQDDYDTRALKGLTGALEHRPRCDGKGKFAPYECIPAHTCFCQSEDGERLFGEVRNLGAITERTLRCGCSRFHDRMRKSISSGVPVPVVGPRCTADGNFYPIQCIANRCYCVDILTGIVEDRTKYIDLQRTPITQLECYDEDTDLYKQYSEGEPPYNFTTPCLLDLKEKIDLIRHSEEEGYNVDYFYGLQECLPDGTFGRTGITRDGRKICIDDRGAQIENYGINRTSDDFETMDCNKISPDTIISRRFPCRIRREETLGCHNCSNHTEDTVEHTVEVCPAWGEHHRVLQETIDGDDLYPALVQAMVRSKREWEAVTFFCETLMRENEAAGTVRLRQASHPGYRRRRTGRRESQGAGYRTYGLVDGEQFS